MNNRETIAEKIRALRAKASNVASTEAEAAQAAAMIAKLLAKYDLSEEDVKDYEGKDAEALQAETEDRMHPVLAYCWRGICELTETQAYKNRDGRLCFIGMEHEIEMALYLSEIISSACDRALKAGFPKASRVQRSSFIMGFGHALDTKLKELAKERQSAKTATGTAIVVRKGELVKDFMDRAGLNLTASRTRYTKADMGYFQAGATVGKALNLNRPLGSSGSASTARLS